MTTTATGRTLDQISSPGGLTRGLDRWFVPQRFTRWTDSQPERYMLRLPLAPRVLLTCSEEDCRAIFTERDGALLFGEGLRRFAPHEAMFGHDAIEALDGEGHTAMRRLLTAAFHGEALKGYEQGMISITQRHVARWPVGRPVRFTELAQDLARDVIATTVFGVTEPGRAARLQKALDELDQTLNSLELSARFAAAILMRGRWAPFGRIQAIHDEIAAVTREEIAERRAGAAAGAVGSPGHASAGAASAGAASAGAASAGGSGDASEVYRAIDGKTQPRERVDCLQHFLDLDLAAIAAGATAADATGADATGGAPGPPPATDAPLDDEWIVGAMRVLVIAGWATTANTLAWIAERLARHPEALARCREDAAEGTSGYLMATVQETLRMRPPVPVTLRYVARDFDLNGLRLPKGTMIAADIERMHYRSDLYPEPRSFRPERFLDQRPGTYSWIPFGGGVHRCIGAGFSLTEARLILQTILQHLTIAPEVSGGERSARRNLITAPANKAMVTLQPLT